MRHVATADTTYNASPLAWGRKSLIVILYIFEYILLGRIYTIYISQSYEYMGYDLYDLNINRSIISIFMIAIFAYLTPTKGGVRSFYLNFIITIYFIPYMILYSYAARSNYSFLIVCFSFSILYIFSAIRIPRITIGDVSASALMQALTIAALAVIACYPLIGGFAHFNLDLQSIYDFRDEAAAALPSLFDYLTPIFGRVIIPFCTAVSLIHRRYKFVFLFIILSVLQFGFTSNRTLLFSPIVVIGFYYFLSKFSDYSAILCAVIFALVISLVDSFIYMNVNGDGIWGLYTSLFVRRVLMVPPLLDSLYIEFFSDNTKYLWSLSRITLGLVAAPYDGVPAPFVIGEVYFASPETSANTGFIGSGYAQAGLLGVALYAGGLGMIISLFDSFGRYLGTPFTVAVTIIVATAFTATDLLSLFLTHGLAVLIFLLMLVQSPEAKQRSYGRRVSSD